jgi:hypothetical protein
MMPLFASPDFGTAAFAALVLLIGFMAVFMLIGIVGALAVRALHQRMKRPSDLRDGPDGAKPAPGCLRIILYGFAVSILGTCLLPRPIFCLYFGRDRADPNGLHVEKGMTEEEVIAKCGRPHEKYQKADGEVEWHYHTDRWGSGVHFDIIRFDREGRVGGSSTH